MTLVVDLRRAFDSGLGTYIREVVPRVLTRLAGVPVVGVIAPGDEARHRAYLGGLDLQWRTCSAAPLSMAEQWPLRRLLPEQAVFWATTLSHPLFTRQRLVASVHDVLQLALPRAAGASGATRLASRVFFESLRQCASLLVFNSRFTQAEFRRCVGQPDGRQLVAALGVDTAQWLPPVLSPGPVACGSGASAAAQAPYFLCVGNLRAHKNLATVLDAFGSAGGTLNHQLWLVGRAQGFRSSDKALLARIHAMAPRVRYLGELDAQALKECVRGATALVMPSLYEGFGLPVLEAMASGCPVIASHAAALPEVAGDAALYFDPLDSAGLLRCLRQMACMPDDERATWTERGLAHVQHRTWDHTATLTAGAVRSVLVHTPAS